MSKRISLKEAKIKTQNEIESQRKNKVGIKPKINRNEKRRRMKMSKTEKFIQMLKDRGGYFKQKEFDDNAGKDFVE